MGQGVLGGGVDAEGGFRSPFLPRGFAVGQYAAVGGESEEVAVPGVEVGNLVRFSVPFDSDVGADPG